MKATTHQAERLMFQGAVAMADMSHNGVRIDMEELDRQIQSTDAEIKELQHRLRDDEVWKVWRKTFGTSAELGSKAQLSTVIFDKMGYIRPKATSKKHRSEEYAKEARESKYDEATFADVKHPFIPDYFRCEKLKKLAGTYLEGIRREVVDGFVHPNINLHTTISYRSSCNSPNLSNVPKRNKEISRRIRGCFIARKGRRLVEIDFKGAEVCVSACYNKDANLIKYICDPDTDMHRDLAAQMFGLSAKFMTDNKTWAKETIRDWAKNRMTFPQFYGSVYFQCAPAIWKAIRAKTYMPDGVTRIRDFLRDQGIEKLGSCDIGAPVVPGSWVHRVKESEDYLWNTMFFEYTAWKNRWHRAYQKKGYFDSLTGFRYKGLFKRNDVLNYGIQGDAFHCNLQCIIWIGEELRKRGMRTRLVNQVYDSILSDVPESELQDFLALCQELITKRLPQTWDWIIVPIQTEVEVSPPEGSWRDIAEWTCKGDEWAPVPKKK